jgi:phage terminase Nu1 subunit (DNA packaging protein)
MTRVTQAEFARLCGVNRSTVTRWLRAGRIVADPSGLIDPEAAARMRAATESPLPHHQARKAQFDEARVAATTSEPASATQEAAGDEDEGQGMEALGQQLKRATVDLQRRKAELAALEVDEKAGALVEMAEVQYVLHDLGTTLRTLLEGLPDRLTGELAAHQGDANAMHKSLEDAAREMLLAISEQMARKAKGLMP